MPLPLYAGLVQGAISACLTLFLKSVIDWLSKRFVGSVRFWAPPLIACLGSASILVAIHAATGTPEILKTIDELRGNLQLFDLGKTRFRYMMGTPLIPFKLRTRLSFLPGVPALGSHSFTAPVIDET
ncbi:hypothetical protein ACVMH6_002492 [Rhizobium leguminosarum]